MSSYENFFFSRDGEQATDWSQFFLPEINPLGAGNQVPEDYLEEPQPSGSTDPVQDRTEGSHTYRNHSILPMDYHPLINPPTYEFPHRTPPIPSQPALPSGPHPYPQELIWIEDGPASERAPTAFSLKKTSQSTRNHHRRLRRCEHPGCLKVYDNLQSLTRHRRKHQPPDPNAKCQYCGRQLSRTDALRRHERACEEYLDALRKDSR